MRLQRVLDRRCGRVDRSDCSARSRCWRSSRPSGPIDAAQVLDAIDRGVAYLKREQLPRGRWNEMTGYDGGVTALCTLALLNSGVRVDDPVVRKALDYLRGLKLDKTYTVALQTMVLAAAEPKKDMLLIRRNVRWLEATSNQGRPRERRLVVSRPGRRQQQRPVRRARPVRCPARRRRSQPRNLGAGRRLLAHARRTTTAPGATCPATPAPAA